MAKIHYDELTVGVPSKASSVNYENADGTKESVQSKIEHMETVELTKEEYDALPYAEKHNGKDYLVKGMSPMTAYNMPYKDSTVGDGLDDIKQNIADLSNNKISYKIYEFETANLPIGTTYMDIPNLEVEHFLGCVYVAVSPTYSYSDIGGIYFRPSDNKLAITVSHAQKLTIRLIGFYTE